MACLKLYGRDRWTGSLETITKINYLRKEILPQKGSPSPSSSIARLSARSGVCQRKFSCIINGIFASWQAATMARAYTRPVHWLAVAMNLSSHRHQVRTNLHHVRRHRLLANHRRATSPPRDPLHQVRVRCWLRHNIDKIQFAAARQHSLRGVLIINTASQRSIGHRSHLISRSTVGSAGKVQ